MSRHGGQARPLLARVVHWTGGHSYLTQRVCEEVARDEEVRGPVAVDRLCDALFLSRRAREREVNLTFVRDRILLGAELEGLDIATVLTLYQRAWSEEAAPADDALRAVTLLKIAGIVRVSYGDLRVRNRIYRTVFDKAWVRENMSDAELRRQRPAFWRGVARTSAIAGAILAAVGAFAGVAYHQWGRAEAATEAPVAESRPALVAVSRTQAERGVRLLNEGDPLGLFDLVVARRTVDGFPSEWAGHHESVWAWWHRLYEGCLVQTIHPGQIETIWFSPDGRLILANTLVSYVTAMVCGSDDALAVWVNGELVHDNPAARGFDNASDIFNVSLREGVNCVLMKVTEHRRGWEAGARFVETDGLLFSTDKRVVRQPAGGGATELWVPANTGLAGRDITALVPDPAGIVVATEAGGVFLFDPVARVSAGLGVGLPDPRVTATVRHASAIYIGTRDTGVFRLDGDRWEAASAGLTDQRITALAAHGDTLYAATWGNVVFRTQDGGENWAAMPTEIQ